MELTVTNRAKEKNIRLLNMLEMEETETYIVGVLHESRNDPFERIDWVNPIIFFKSDIKHGDYDRIKKIAEAAGVLFLLPEPKNFETDYYSVQCNGVGKMLKSWGYASINLPRSRRWDTKQIQEKATIWMKDFKVIAEIIDYVYAGLIEGRSEEALIQYVKEDFNAYIA